MVVDQIWQLLNFFSHFSLADGDAAGDNDDADKKDNNNSETGDERRSIDTDDLAACKYFVCVT